MKKGLTELVFILDKSGSMVGLEKDTIGGYNAMLQQQKDIEGKCRITTVLFDDKYELLHNRIDLSAVIPITEKEYRVGGMTALVDAIGITMNKIINVQKDTAEEYRAEKVMFVIMTDGEENSSREYTAEQIKKMIEEQKEKYGWEFIFLGANIDSVETAGRFGIGADRAVEWIADAKGTAIGYETMSQAVTGYRVAGVVAKDVFHTLEDDVKKRGKSKQVK